jgi:hypothetical protein
MIWYKNCEYTPSDIYPNNGDNESEGFYLVYFNSCLSYYQDSFQILKWNGYKWYVPFSNLEVTYWMKLPEIPES